MTTTGERWADYTSDPRGQKLSVNIAWVGIVIKTRTRVRNSKLSSLLAVAPAPTMSAAHLCLKYLYVEGVNNSFMALISASNMKLSLKIMLYGASEPRRKSNIYMRGERERE